MSLLDRMSLSLRGRRRERARPLPAAEEDLLAAAPERTDPASRGELVTYVVLAGGYVLASAVFIASLGAGPAPDAGAAITLTLAFAVLSRIRFDAGTGYTAPIQLAFVPMLFIAGPAWTLVLVAAGMTLGQVHATFAEGQHPSRILTAPGNAWFALGPALVFELADAGGAALGDWPIYVAALCAQFAVDFGVGAVGERMSHGVSPGVQLRVMAPIWAVDALLSPIGLLAAMATSEQPYAFLLVLALGVLLSTYAREHRTRIDQAIELSTAYRNTALLLADVIGIDDQYTGEHSRGVVELATSIGKQMKVDADQMRLVELGSLLHDVGKLAMPKEIINKPGPLDEREWETIRTHTLLGQQMLDRVGGTLSDIGLVVRASHERFDGGGYPDRVARADIPLASRIISVADAHGAMTSDRPYRARLSDEEALRRLREGAGSQFDPDVVEALLVVLGRAAVKRRRRSVHALAR